MRFRHSLTCLASLLCFTASTSAGDWPQWRYDAGRGAATPEELPAELHLKWMRQLATPRPAWPESQPWLRFDTSYSPVAADNRLFVPSMVNDSVTAYDAETGDVLWRFVTDGPVRLAPIVDQGKVYFASDDGHLYCVTADAGQLLWRFRGGSSDRMVLGNERLISTWPIRGGPVLFDGTIYFTAGIWPFMGIFVHAVDAATGHAVWTNSGESCPYLIQPHNSPAFGGFVPRGHLAASDAGLVIPGGRTTPACYDRKTGRQLPWQWTHKGGGTHQVTAFGPWYFGGGFLRQVADGAVVAPALAMVHDDTAAYSLVADVLSAEALVIEERTIEKPDRKGRTETTTKPMLKPLWKLPVPESCGWLYLKAGSRFFAGKQDRVTALEAKPDAEIADVVWQASIDGEPWTMLASGDRLFVITIEGRIYAFGSRDRGLAAGRGRESFFPVGRAMLSKKDGSSSGRQEKKTPDPLGPQSNATRIVQAAGVDEGYAVVLGLDDTELPENLVGASKLRVIVLDSDPQRVEALRRRTIDAGLYGTCITALEGDPAHYPFPPYLADLVIATCAWTADSAGEAMAAQLARILRPYGGTAWLPAPKDKLQSLVGSDRLSHFDWKAAGKDATLLIRSGPLPGSADWTHQYGDPANTVVSQEERVKAPLGLLWFGGPSNDEVLPRRGHGPAPQVAAGRLFIEGANMLRALDIYTGRLLWQKDLPGLGRFYDNTSHQPGANEIGSNYVSLPDSVYVTRGGTILRLDAATGRILREFPVQTNADNPDPRWGYLAVEEEVLVATSTPMIVRADAPAATTDDPAAEPSDNAAGDDDAKPGIDNALAPAKYASTSRRLTATDRYTGRSLWQRAATYGFRHNNIAIGSGKLFVIDGLSAAQESQLARRGVDLEAYPSRLLAIDLRTGEERWSTSEDVFGTFLSYSAQHDVLLQAGSASRDRAADETGAGMIAYRGSDGTVLWQALDRRHVGPCLLHDDTVITQGEAYSLMTGEPKLRRHPLTGEPLPWTFKRNYGCNTAIASRHLLTFRSAAAGFFDLASDGGTGNLGGFKSGCTSNLIAAGGLLNAPEYTRTCGCNYQNQTSLAMIHDPSAEMWTFNDLPWDGKPVRRVGINFGAPGDRRADNGTLWLEWPSVGGPSPDLPLTTEPEQVDTFRRHSSLITVPPEGDGLAWTAASGLRGVRRIELTLAKQPARAKNYTVRLHFVEPDRIEAGQRRINVRLQGKEVLAGLDIAKEAGTMTALVKEFRGVAVTDELLIELAPADGAVVAEPVLAGVEALAE